MAEINTRYQIQECVDWITTHEYLKVVLQFSDAEMPHSVDVVKSLKNFLTHVEFYTVVTASCSVDYLAPLRLGEDIIQAIICYGAGASKTNLCLPSSTAFDQLPVLYVFGSDQELNYTLQSNNCLVLYDIKCLPFLSHFIQSNNIHQDNIGKVIRRNDSWNFTSNVTRFVTNQSDTRIIFGNFSLHEDLDHYEKIVWIGYCDDLFYQVNLSKDDVLLIQPAIVPTSSILNSRTILSKRLSLIEKAKKASNIGLVFNNSIPNVDKVLDRVKRLSVKKGKKLFYLSLVQEADNTKFGNFPLVEVFVIISSCSCGSLAKGVKAHTPLITLTEYEISLGMKTMYGGLEWSSEDLDDEETCEVQISNNQIMEYKQQMANSWYGLQVAAGHDPVVDIEIGSRGVASGYDHEAQ